MSHHPHIFNRIQQRLPLLVVGFSLSFAPIALLNQTAIAQITEAKITEILDGDAVFIDEAIASSDPDLRTSEPAQVDSVAEFQETVRTEDSRAALLFDNGAVGRMGPNSRITVGQCIEVQQGMLLAAGPANGCTATFAVGVQGTIYAIAVDEAEDTRNVQVLEGEVTVTLADGVDAEDVGIDGVDVTELSSEPTTDVQDPNSRERVRIVRAGEQVAIGPQGRFGEKRAISEQEVLMILAGFLFDGFESELPGVEKLQTVLKELYPGIDLPRLPGFRFPRPSFPPIRGLFLSPVEEDAPHSHW